MSDETKNWHKNHFGQLEKEIDGRTYEVSKTPQGWECWSFGGVTNRLVWEPLRTCAKAQVMAHRHAESRTYE